MTSQPKYIVAYDIANPQRLRRVARYLEKHAMRCQKSVFIYRGSWQRLREILDHLAGIIDAECDVIQAWRLPTGQSASGIRRGRATILFPDVVVIDEDVRFVGSSREGKEE